jgi:hypothetical protein
MRAFSLFRIVRLIWITTTDIQPHVFKHHHHTTGVTHNTVPYCFMFLSHPLTTPLPTPGVALPCSDSSTSDVNQALSSKQAKRAEDRVQPLNAEKNEEGIQTR